LILNPVTLCRILLAHRRLLWQFTLRNVEIRHRGSALGLAWAVLNPLLILALYVFVFGFIFEGRFNAIPDETNWDYGLGVFVGLTLFHVVAEAIAVAPTIIVTNPNFVKKVVFPLEVLPAAAVGASVVHMAISLVLILIGVFISGGHVTPAILALPFIILPIIAIALGLTWVFAALGVFFRDIGQLVGAMTAGLLFASAIFYPVSKILIHAPVAWHILKFNPLIHAAAMARDVILWGRPASISHLIWLNIAGLVCAWLGLACFLRLKRAFADVI